MRILLVTARPPWPPWRGDQLRARQWREALAPPHRVTWLAPAAVQEEADPEVERVVWDPDPPWRRIPEILRGLLVGLPAQAALYCDRGLSRQLRRLAPQHDLVIVLLARLAGYLPALAGVPLVVDLIDALSLSFRRRAVVDRLWWRPLWRAEAGRLTALEGRLLEAARRVTVVCARDARWLAGAHPETAHRVKVTPVALSPRRRETSLGSDPRPTLAFTGNLGYFVNLDAAEWLLAEVWPRLKARRPELRLLVAGDRPPRRLVRRIAAGGADLVVRPDDLPARLASCRAALAPMRAGAGVSLKILEAWSEGVPVVASPWAAEGVGEEDGGALLVAREPAQWVAAVEAILDQPELAARLTARGRAKVAAEHSPERVFPLLREVVHGALEEGAEAACPR